MRSWTQIIFDLEMVIIENFNHTIKNGARLKQNRKEGMLSKSYNNAKQVL